MLIRDSRAKEKRGKRKKEEEVGDTLHPRRRRTKRNKTPWMDEKKRSIDIFDRFLFLFRVEKRKKYQVMSPLSFFILFCFVCSLLFLSFFPFFFFFFLFSFFFFLFSFFFFLFSFFFFLFSFFLFLFLCFPFFCSPFFLLVLWLSCSPLFDDRAFFWYFHFFSFSFSLFLSCVFEIRYLPPPFSFHGCFLFSPSFFFSFLFLAHFLIFSPSSPLHPLISYPIQVYRLLFGQWEHFPSTKITPSPWLGHRFGGHLGLFFN